MPSHLTRNSVTANVSGYVFGLTEAFTTSRVREIERHPCFLGVTRMYENK